MFSSLDLNESKTLKIFEAGTHPDLEELVSVLNERPSSQSESLSRDNLVSSLPGHSCLTEKESVNTRQQRKSTSELQSQSDEQSSCSETENRTGRIVDFNLDDDCNEVVSRSQQAVETSLRTAGEKQSVMSNQDMESSDDETQDPTDSKTPPQRRNVDDVVRDCGKTLRNLTEANKKFKEIIKDPYNKDDSNDEAGSTEGSSRSKKSKKYLAPQEHAQQLGWDETDSDSSFDDIQEQHDQRKKNIATHKRKKCPWSQDEMDYIRDGVRRFGAGDWAGIRDHYPFQIAHLDSIKIKDKYRNMLKNGLIIQPESDS